MTRWTVIGESLLHRRPQLSGSLAEIWWLEHWELSGDHMRDQASLITEAAIADVGLIGGLIAEQNRYPELIEAYRHRICSPAVGSSDRSRARTGARRYPP